LRCATTRPLHATRDAAYSCRAENKEGRIAVGHFADFTVLAANPLAAEPAELLTNHVRLTVVGGRAAYRATIDEPMPAMK
jgi:predicted amidohydrolase YtcJ